MSAIRSLQRMNAQKLSAGDQQVRHEMRQREATVRSDFQRALVEIETRFAKLIADEALLRRVNIDEEAAARNALAERQDNDTQKMLLFVDDETGRIEEKVDRTISYRIVAAWRAVVVYVAGMFSKGGAA